MDGRAPGVFVEFVEAAPAIEPTRVDVLALVCVTERGPVNTPVRLGSWTAFAHIFGDFVPNGLGAYTAKAAFDGGAAPLWVVRVAAPERTTATTGPQPADRRSSVVADLTGLVPGAVATLTQPGIGRDYLVTAVDAGTSTVGWDRPLHPGFDLTVSADVATGVGVATVTLADGGGVPSLVVQASSPGAWGSRLEVVAGPGGRATTTTRPGTPSGTLVTAVVTTAGFRVGESCRISQDVGGATTVADALVVAVDAGRRTLTWSASLPGTLDLTKPLTIEATTFALGVLFDGAVVESWPDLSLEPAHPRYAPALLVASGYVRGAAAGTAQPAPARVRLAGGRDGTAALTTADVIGDELLDDRIGLAALLDVDEPAMLALPDLVSPPTTARVLDRPPPADPCDPCAEPDADAPAPLEAILIEAGASFGDDEVVAAQRLAIESCERNTERIVLLDPPHHARTLADLRAWAARFSSSYAVTVAPWVSVVEPRDSSRLRLLPACGHLAGLIARCDADVGPWQSPANRTLPWSHGVALTLDESGAAVANDAGINMIRALPGRGLVPMGSRTLAADDQWRFVSVRRTMIFLRRTLRHHLAWVPFEPNDAGLATLLAGSIATLLTGIWEVGGLAGDTAEDAYAVAVDSSRAPVGQLQIVVGAALARPAEFVLARVTKTGNRLEITEAPTLVLAGGGI